ncbi:hypothetical protein BJ508DRAFT_316068 [Ascobolus immersus RN42]|uniref:Uncharacterized protein n=1 Tax=Ascobolus immersus RN42 TaxID=1160509 RepID=A0A3N4H7Y3_ASCIM|nr:hypothetical protein BJ508DRAFT_316068 [Ascobolus immersus RN42]
MVCCMLQGEKAEDKACRKGKVTGKAWMGAKFVGDRPEATAPPHRLFLRPLIRLNTLLYPETRPCSRSFVCSIRIVRYQSSKSVMLSKAAVRAQKKEAKKEAKKENEKAKTECKPKTRRIFYLVEDDSEESPKPLNCSGTDSYARFDDHCPYGPHHCRREGKAHHRFNPDIQYQTDNIVARALHAHDPMEEIYNLFDGVFDLYVAYDDVIDNLTCDLFEPKGNDIPEPISSPVSRSEIDIRYGEIWTKCADIKHERISERSKKFSAFERIERKIILPIDAQEGELAQGVEEAELAQSVEESIDYELPMEFAQKIGVPMGVASIGTKALAISVIEAHAYSTLLPYGFGQARLQALVDVYRLERGEARDAAEAAEQERKIAAQEKRRATEILAAAALRGSSESIMKTLGTNKPCNINPEKQITPKQRRIFIEVFGERLGVRAGKPTEADRNSKIGLSYAIFARAYDKWSSRIHGAVDVTNVEHVRCVFEALEVEEDKYVSAALHNLVNHGYEFKLREKFWASGSSHRHPGGPRAIDLSIKESDIWVEWKRKDIPLPETPDEHKPGEELFWWRDDLF